MTGDDERERAIWERIAERNRAGLDALRERLGELLSDDGALEAELGDVAPDEEDLELRAFVETYERNLDEEALAQARAIGERNRKRREP